MVMRRFSLSPFLESRQSGDRWVFAGFAGVDSWLGCRQKMAALDPAIYLTLTAIGLAVLSSGICGSSGFVAGDRRFRGVSRLNWRIL
jgi:hypothetical protein